MKEFLIERVSYGEKQTLGNLFVLNKNKEIQFDCKTLELPWLNNKVRESCIPEGNYWVQKRWSPRFKNHFHITDVNGRTFILIHPGNYHSQILGCVLVGDDFKDINNDGLLDMVNSRKTLNKLLDMMPNRFKLKIVNV